MEFGKNKVLCGLSFKQFKLCRLKMSLPHWKNDYSYKAICKIKIIICYCSSLKFCKAFRFCRKGEEPIRYLYWTSLQNGAFLCAPQTCKLLDIQRSSDYFFNTGHRNCRPCINVCSNFLYRKDKDAKNYKLCTQLPLLHQ